MSVDIVGNDTLPRVFDRRLAADPDSEVAVFCRADGTVQRLSLCALDEQADSCARGLVELGVGPADRVAVQLSNRPEFLVAWLALGRLGAVLVPCNTG